MVDRKEFATLSCVRDGAVATVTLERPESLNALNAMMFDDLERVFDYLASDGKIRSILLTGSGERAFCAGADIRGLVLTDAASGKAVSERGQQVFLKIACVNGVALGGGCELALACTLRIASDSARFGLPEVKLGLIPGYGGTQRLPALIGRSAALRLMLTAQVVDASEALRLGLVDELVPSADLVPPANLLTRARSVAETISAMAPLAVAGILEAVQRDQAGIAQEGYRAEAEIFGRLCGTADKHEGLTAFLEKRPAAWQGK
jgi:enoyl-CoA hydratase